MAYNIAGNISADPKNANGGILLLKQVIAPITITRTATVEKMPK
jgi:hypothetical protein